MWLAQFSSANFAVVWCAGDGTLPRSLAIVPADSNIRLVPFTNAENLAARLSGADVHVVTLREEWAGAVVPLHNSLVFPRSACLDSSTGIVAVVQRLSLI